MVLTSILADKDMIHLLQKRNVFPMPLTKVVGALSMRDNLMQ